ncbi:MAG TPA: WD40 repeat domain-containing protein [Kofleriaceae bacterium]
MLDDSTLSPDGELVVAGGADGRLRVWEAGTGRALWTTPADTHAVVGVGFNGEDVVTRGLGGDVARWRILAK